MHAEMDPYIQRKIIKKHGASTEEREDPIAVEKRLRVSLNGKDFITLHCTPLMIKELVVGLFLTEGIITEIRPEDMKIEYGEEMRIDVSFTGDASPEGMITSRCIGGITLGKKREFEKVGDDFFLETAALEGIFDEFQQMSYLFRDCLKMCTVEYSHISKQGSPYRSCSRNSRDNRDDPCRFCKGR